MTDKTDSDTAECGPWNCGNEFLPYHPAASHVSPDFRDGWNHCYRASLAASAGSEPVAKERFSEPLSRVIHAGYALANCAFNLAQKPGEVLTPSTANTLSDCRKEWDAACAAFKAHPSPPEGMVGGWQDIATAPEGQLVVVGWLDTEDTEHPERHEFDYLEDGCWQKWHDHAEHVEIIGGHGVSYTPPYTCWMPLPPIAAGGGKEAGHGAD